MLHILTRLATGSALLAVDFLVKALPEEEPDAIQSPPDRPQTEAVPIPAAEWETILRREPEKSARHALIGLISASQSHLHRGGVILQRVENVAEGVINFAFKPVRTSRVFAPVRDGYQKLIEQGEAEVTRWVELGQAEETHSRELAETTLNRLVENSVDELEDDPRVRVYVQDLVQGQGAGLIKEIRERIVTGDILLDRLVRSLLRRPPQETPTAPTPTTNDLAQPEGDRPKVVEQGLQGQHAGFVSRLFALGIDVVIVAVSLTLASWFLTSLGQIFGLDDLWGILGSRDTTGVRVASSGLFATFSNVGYLLLFWCLTGQTLGHMLMGLRVVTLDGDYLSFWRSVRRVIGYYLAALPFFLGFLWALVDKRQQGWHDKVAGTCVIYTWAAQPDETVQA